MSVLFKMVGDGAAQNVFQKVNSPFDYLDDKILEKIFSYFHPNEMIEDLCLVCKRWQTIVTAMKKSVTFNNANAYSVLQFICKFPDTLNSLSLTNIKGSIAVILKKLRRKQKYLKQMHIDGCEIVPDGNQYVAGRRLRNFLEVCRYLERLSLKNVKYHVDDLLDTFSWLQDLRALAIGNNPLLKPVDVITIVMSCTGLQCITLYRIDGMKDQDLKFLLCNERLSGNLQELSLDQVTELTSVAYQYILDCKNLKKLHINYSTGFSSDTLMEIPIKLSSLRSFTIERACRISAGNLCEFFKDGALKLNEFGLTDCCSRFHDGCLRILLEHQCHNLVHLALRNCLHLKNVSTIFEKCKFLRSLDLSGCETLESKISMSTESSMNLSRVILPSHLCAHQEFIPKRESIRLEFQEGGDSQEIIEFESVLLL